MMATFALVYAAATLLIFQTQVTIITCNTFLISRVWCFTAVKHQQASHHHPLKLQTDSGGSHPKN